LKMFVFLVSSTRPMLCLCCVIAFTKVGVDMVQNCCEFRASVLVTHCS
jgi:hypothetical protein